VQRDRIRFQGKSVVPPWPPGEWDDEPDSIVFRYLGLQCGMKRNQVGTWCGYVAVPKSHPAYVQEYEKLNVDVHGGLTYADTRFPVKWPWPTKPPMDVTVFGFDCGHWMDFSPGMPLPGHLMKDGEEYRNVEYVVTEIKSLAFQFATLSYDTYEDDD